MHRTVTLLLLFAVIAGCSNTATTGRPSTIPQPDLDARLTHELFFGSSSTAPATIEVTVGNRGSVPIVIRRVEIDSPGMGQYAILRTIRDFHEEVPPGQQKAVTVFATAQTTVRRPTEPLTLRAIIEFESGEHRWREILMQRE